MGFPETNEPQLLTRERWALARRKDKRSFQEATVYPPVEVGVSETSRPKCRCIRGRRRPP